MKKLLVLTLLGAGLALPLVGCHNNQTPTQSGTAGSTGPVDPSRADNRPTQARQTGAGATQTTNRATNGPAGG